MAEKKIRIGIIGANAHYGWGMRGHLPAILALPEYELAAVCTAHRETAEESARHYGARLAFHDYREMVKHPDIDLVSVSVPVPFHHSMVMAALEAGKHVFSEWPLGANVAEAEEMAGRARSNGTQHMVCLQGQCDPALLRIRELLAEGYVGDVLSCNVSLVLPGILQRGLGRAWAGDKEKGAHTLSIFSGHTIDALCFCVGEFKDLSAQVRTQVPTWETSEPGKPVEVTAPDNIMVSGVLTNGAVASVHVAHVPWHGAGWRMEIYGREGTLVASSRGILQYTPIRLQGGQAHPLGWNATEPSDDSVLEDLPVPNRLTWVPEDVPRGIPFNMAQIYRRMGEAINTSKGTTPDFDLAVKRHRLLDTIQRSSDLGVRQTVA